MGDLKDQNTSYPTTLDTATTIADVTDEVIAAHNNGPNTAIIAIETELGVNPSGTATDLASRLAINMDDDGGVRRGSSFPASPPAVPHFFYKTDEDQFYLFNTSTANYEVISTATVLASYIQNNVPTTITVAHTFNPTVAGAPFVLGANAIGQKVIGLDAETVDGKNPGSASGLATLSAGSVVVERLSYEGTASGVATLNASSKVVQEPASKGLASGLATLDGSTKVVERLVYEAAASGVATLNGSSKVVQEPASKAQASGIASLNAGGLVVQKPADEATLIVASCTGNAATATAVSNYSSTAQTITAAGSLSLTHSLGSTPSLTSITLQCVSAEGNYSVNDLVEAPVFFLEGANSWGASITKTSTQLVIRYAAGDGGNVFVLPNKTTGVEFPCTSAKWKAIFRAWK